MGAEQMIRGSQSAGLEAGVGSKGHTDWAASLPVVQKVQTGQSGCRDGGGAGGF